MTTPPIQDITLRDFLAAAALTGLLANGKQGPKLVVYAYEIANAMLEERKNDPA
jgi:hypothetical protein